MNRPTCSKFHELQLWASAGATKAPEACEELRKAAVSVEGVLLDGSRRFCDSHPEESDGPINRQFQFAKIPVISGSILLQGLVDECKPRPQVRVAKSTGVNYLCDTFIPCHQSVDLDVHSAGYLRPEQGRLFSTTAANGSEQAVLSRFQKPQVPVIRLQRRSPISLDSHGFNFLGSLTPKP